MKLVVIGMIIGCIPWLIAYFGIYERELRRLRRDNARLRKALRAAK